MNEHTHTQTWTQSKWEREKETSSTSETLQSNATRRQKIKNCSNQNGNKAGERCNLYLIAFARFDKNRRYFTTTSSSSSSNKLKFWTIFYDFVWSNFDCYDGGGEQSMDKMLADYPSIGNFIFVKAILMLLL